jgi:hypothetical protein
LVLVLQQIEFPRKFFSGASKPTCFVEQILETPPGFPVPLHRLLTGLIEIRVEQRQRVTWLSQLELVVLAHDLHQFPNPLDQR